MALRVLVAEDSAVARQLLVGILGADPDLEVVGQARHGQEAVRMTAELKPDVITMDVHMPVMGGLEAIREIMAATPRPIVVVSANDPKDVASSFQALDAGALSVLGKPRGPRSPDFVERARELTSTVKTMARMKVVTRRRRSATASSPVRRPARPIPPRPATPGRRPLANRRGPAATPAPPARSPSLAVAALRRVDLIAIGSSTGGPAALSTVLGALPTSCPVPILVVQHIAAGFDQGLVDWLDTVSPLSVRLATHGEPLRPGSVLVAPCGRHLAVGPERTADLSFGPTEDGHRPSATHLFHSVARTYGRHALGVILTGMGEDGANGLVALKAAGGQVIAQDRESCVVYGMPAAAVNRGVVDDVAPIGAIAGLVTSAWARGRPGG